jgi:16S rRNA (cytidine1402-2'-O)-methyltransferase
MTLDTQHSKLNTQDSQLPTLFLVATPIGNLEDITLRALRVLGEADVLACEDTRLTRNIFTRHNVKPPASILAYHEHNEERAGEKIVALLAEGKTVAFCTDAGMPSVSDPGYRIASLAIARGFRVEVIPGPSAVETALVASGLPTSSYLFKGFPPRKEGKLRNFLAEEKDRPHTLVLFESPYRVGKLLAAALEVLGDRKAAVCLELTKKFENVRRGFLSELLEEFGTRETKGEVTVAIAGNNPKFARDVEDDEDDEEIRDTRRGDTGEGSS